MFELDPRVQCVSNLVQIFDDWVPPLVDGFPGAKSQIRFYKVPLGYRVEIFDDCQKLHWHPGIFPEIEVALNWSIDSIRRSLTECNCLFGTGGFLDLDPTDCSYSYRGWFICDWWVAETEAYDPLTNRCILTKSVEDAMSRIDKIEDDRLVTPGQLALF
ncbi:MAG: hypothetical protein WBB28_27180 [Crinalium sp.]